MSIPFTGALVLILGLLFFLFSPKLLYAAMIVSIPFPATVVINFGSGDAARGIGAWLFLGALWIARTSMSDTPPWRKNGWLLTRRPRNGLFAFWCAVVASLCVPLFLNGTAWVPSLDPISLQVLSTPLRYGVNNQVRTLTFGILLAILVAAENCTVQRLFYTLKLYVGSCVFLASWGLFQFWCYATGHEYPAYVFNNSTSLVAIGYQETLAPAGLDIHRVSSAAFEPSVLAEELLIALVILLVCRGLRKPVLSRRRDLAAITLIGVGLLVTTSTTAYVGILLVLLTTGIALFLAGKPSKIYFISVGAVTAAGVAIAALVPLLSQVASIVLLNKMEGASGAARLQSVVVAAHDFVKYPLLGVGWQRVYSSDLVFLVLANTGLVGLIALLSFLYPSLRSLWTLARGGLPTAVVLLAAMIVVLALAEGAMFEFLAGYDWLFFGLAASAVGLASTESSIVKRRAVTVRTSRDLPSAAGAAGLA